MRRCSRTWSARAQQPLQGPAECLAAPASRPRPASCSQAFYGRKVTARQLLLGGAVPPPPAAAALYAALDALMEHAGEAGGSAAASVRGSTDQQQQRQVHPPAAAGAASYPGGGCTRDAEYASSGSEDEWEPEEEPAASAPPAPAPHASFFGGLGGLFAAEASQGRLATYPPLPQAAGARSLYPSLDEEPLPYGSLFD